MFMSVVIPSCRGVAAVALLLLVAPAVPLAQTPLANPVDKFRQLEEILPTPNGYRTASGAPGHRYWQQRADYVIDVELDEANRRITGRETVTYRNNSPDALTYLWLQLDQNIFQKDSDANLTRTAPSFTGMGERGRGGPPEGAGAAIRGPRMAYDSLDSLLASMTFDGGHRITAVTDASGAPLPHRIVKTMMRIDLKQPLPPQGVFVFKVDWNYNINDAKRVRARSGYEHFPEDGNDIFEIAQWFPRLAAYTDVNGWHHKQFLGSGEFTLEFGDYLVRINVPADHVVGASGVLQNAAEVLTPAQRERLARAATAPRPVLIVTPEEARENEKEKASGRKTWVFEAKNVRDFAFASSRKFIWDAQGHLVDGNPARVMAMSFYPNEGNPLWEKYSTAAVIHTLNVYSRYSFAYPYPVAISVNGPVGGMEYPMICFNGPRPEKDGTYAERTKYGLISVVIHEVGHNYFPMIVNSDERQWTWMDEGLNTFLQYLAEREWETDFPFARRRAARHRRVPAVVHAGPDHDELRVGPAARPQRLQQAGDGPEHPARDDPRPRAVRHRVQGVRRALEVQAAGARRLLPHDGRRLRRRPRLVLARVVLLDRLRRPGDRVREAVHRGHAEPRGREAAAEDRARRRARLAVGAAQRAAAEGAWTRGRTWPTSTTATTRSTSPTPTARRSPTWCPGSMPGRRRCSRPRRTSTWSASGTTAAS